MRIARLVAVALAVLGGATASAAPRQDCNLNTVWHDVDPLWSPTGEWIAFLRQQIGCGGPPALWVARPDGSGARQLARAHVFSPSWSPDGTRVLFGREGRNPFGLPELVVVPLRDPDRLEVIARSALAPTWAPRGELVAYRGDMGNVVVHDLKSGLARTVASATVDWTPVAWSPDGTRLAYSVYASFFARSSHIEVVNVDGSGRHPVSEPLAPHPDYQFTDQKPVWSPSGDLIAYESNRDGNFEIYTVRPDGTGRRNVTHNPAEDIRPAWRAGTNELTFISDRGEGQAPWGRRKSLYSVDLAAGTTRRLAHDLHPQSTVAWSPSGATLAFASGRECERWGLYVSAEPEPARITNRCRFRGTPLVDRLVGTPFKDFLFGLGGNDLLRGDAGGDLLDGGPGRNALYGGAGEDAIRARNGRRDLVDCGWGRDSAIVDRIDRVRGCESVSRS